MKRLAIAIALAVALPLIWATAARALPAQRPADAWMVEGQTVRAVEHAKGVVVLGGRFVGLQDPSSGETLEAHNLGALDASTGEPIWTARIEDTIGTATVWDLAISPDGSVVYACGNFNRVNGNDHRNLVAFDAATGAYLRAFKPAAKTCWSVSTDGASVFAGHGRSVDSYSVDGDDEWSTPADGKVWSVVYGGGSLFVAGRFESIGGGPHRVAARLNPSTGAVDVGWVLGGGKRIGRSAFGHELHLEGRALYLAAGGSDFAARFNSATGSTVWKTDTSGSTQTIEPYGQGKVVIGGHFEWVADRDTRQCGSNAHPVTTCTKRLRLAALDARTGALVLHWDPSLTGRYGGARGLAVDGAGHLHIGGEFSRVSGVKRMHYAVLP